MLVGEENPGLRDELVGLLEAPGELTDIPGDDLPGEPGVEGHHQVLGDVARRRLALAAGPRGSKDERVIERVELELAHLPLGVDSANGRATVG